MFLSKIHPDIQTSKQFCFWKSLPSTDPSKKSIKKPYGFCKETKKFIPSLNKSKFWLNWQEVLCLEPNLPKDFGLGIVLNNGPYIVIDLDNCIISNKSLKLLEPVPMILKMFLGAYIEISPSGKGLHIIFRGAWPYKKNKGLYFLNDQLQKGTIEIYSGNDCRYITLTGRTMNTPLDNSGILPSYDNFYSEMQFLYFKYFSKNLSQQAVCQNSNDLSLSLLNEDNHLLVPPSQNFFNQSLGTLQRDFVYVKSKIENSKYCDQYKVLCNINPAKYKSISECDWYFCILVVKFFSTDQKNPVDLLYYFLISERPYRAKMDRLDYCYQTAYKICQLAKEANFLGSFLNVKKINKNVSDSIDKKSIFRICNKMNIFHLGRVVINKSKEILISDDPDNFLQATIPISLNHKDYDYYMQILKQVSDKINGAFPKDLSIENFSIEINIHQILCNLNLKVSGRAYQDFMHSLDKMSTVTLMYDKKISASNCRYKRRSSLISYEYIESVTKTTYKKLIVFINPLNIELMLRGKYNYALFNLESYKSLDKSELRFLYYHFCLGTIPGGYTITYKIEDLILLWPRSNNKSTLSKRRQIILNLLEKLVSKSEHIQDLEFYLIRDQEKIQGISVKKRKLNIRL